MTRSRQLPLVLAWLAALFAGTWLIHTRAQHFAYFRHPDEPGKAEQLIKGEWNFHHPLLLLRATKWCAQIASLPAEPQQIVQAGRSVSAAFTAMAVVAFSLLAYLWRGWLAALLTGLALAFHHQLYELSHYMKEDPALLMGTALTMLAAAWFAAQPSARRAALLGAACAIAISGKYLGAILLVFALPVIWAHETTLRFRSFTAFFCALAAVLVFINLPLISDRTTFERSFAREMDFVVHGQRGMTRNIPHAQYWNVFLDNTTPVIWLGMIGVIVRRWKERSQTAFVTWAITAFPFLYALLLSFSPKSNDRYFLPATALFTFIGVLGIRDLAYFASSRVSERVTLAVMSIALLALQLFGWSSSRPGWWRYHLAFQQDDPQELADWIRAELPEESVIVADRRAGLPEPASDEREARGRPLPQKTSLSRYAADFGTLDELRSRGITHVVVSENAYGRFFLRSLSPHDSEREAYLQRKQFYEQLFREGTLLWARQRGTVIYLHPGIRLYALTR